MARPERRRRRCSHAYLAGAKALILHLLTMPGDRAPVRALAAKIELEMMQNSASLALRRFSDDPFDTADIVGPHWSEISFDPASCFWFVAMGWATAGYSPLAMRPKRPLA
jgi:hypothetical protein